MTNGSDTTVSHSLGVFLVAANLPIDEETFAAKKAWADGYCFGGTMVWSIDFQASS